MEFVFSSCSVCFFFSWRSTSSVVSSSWWPSIRKSLTTQRCKNVSITHHTVSGLTVQIENIVCYNFAHFDYFSSLIKVQKISDCLPIGWLKIWLDIIAFRAIISFFVWDGLLIENCNMR